MVNDMDDKMRKLNKVRKLWEAIMTEVSVKDIFSGEELNNNSYDVDHFVPWSYVAMDELWDLIPAEKSANTSKNNRLPEWKQYAGDYMYTQYQLYTEIYSDESVRALFEKCRKHNLNSRWASMSTTAFIYLLPVCMR